MTDLLFELSCDDRGEVSGLKLNLSYKKSPEKVVSSIPIPFKVNASVRLRHIVDKNTNL